MIIGKVSSSITTEERAKVSDLPASPNEYLIIPRLATEPGTGTDGEFYYNTTEEQLYLYDTDAWVEVAVSMEPITP